MRFPGFARKQKTSRVSARTAASDSDPALRLVVITEDEEFYVRLRQIAGTCNWEIGRAASIDEVAKLTKSKPTPLVVYERDWNGGNWRDGIRRVNELPAQPCVLLASQVADDYLLQEVVRHHGYDVLPKSAPPKQLIGCLNFAWFWAQTGGTRDTPGRNK